MTKRMIDPEAWTYQEFVLASGQLAEQGHLACLNTATGLVVPGQASATLIPIGWFDQISDKAGITGDGVKKVTVRLFEETEGGWWENDSNPNDVQAGDVGNSCYIKDSKTVSMDGTGRSIAGRILRVSPTKGVLVQAGFAVTGPTGSVGASILGGGVADRTALKAVAAAERYDGKLVLVRSDGSLWRFVAASALTADGADELVIVPTAGTGRWYRADKSATLKLPIAFGLADGATIFTVPTGFVLRLTGLPFWDVTVSWTGGTASTIGVSASVTGYTTAGDILGGAAGDVAAALTAGVRPGTVGVTLDTEAERQAFILQGGDTLRYEEITSAFTAGAGFVCLPVSIGLAG